MAEDKIDLPGDIRGRCFSCGFLGAYRNPATRSGIAGTEPIYEVPWGARSTGKLWQAGVDNEEVETAPICVRFVQSFTDDAFFAGDEEKGIFVGDDEECYRLTRNLLAKDRGCDEWHQYTPRFSPKEHLEEARMLELERMRRDQTEIMTKIMEDHKEITEKLATINSDQVTADQRQENSNRRFNILFVGIGIIAVILALSPLAYPEGIGWVVDNAPGAINPQSEQQAGAFNETPTPVPSPAADTASGPTPSPESIPDTGSPQPQSTP